MVTDTVSVKEKYLKEGRWDVVLYALNLVLVEKGFKLTSAKVEGDDKVFFKLNDLRKI